MRLLMAALAIILMAGCDGSFTLGPATALQGSGHVKTESRSVSGFDRVEMDGVGTLVITQGTTEGLSITSDDNVLPVLRSDVENGTLHLGPKPGTGVNVTRLEYDVTVKQLHAISLLGSGEARASSVNTDSLSVSVMGSGPVTVAGQAQSQKVSIMGSGDYHAASLDSHSATITIGGSGSADVRVSDSLNATIMGSGQVTYAGSPAVTENVMGSGSVSKAG